MNDTLRMLEILNEGFPKISQMDPLAARKAVDERVRPTENLGDAISADVTVPAGNREISVRSYRPAGQKREESTVTVYAHGGGFLHGSIASHDSFCRVWAKQTGTTVVSLDYRLAPEWGAPAPAEDVLRVVEWVRTSGLGEDIVLAGDSSGASAVLVAALMHPMRNPTPLRGLVALYPFLDPEQGYPSHEEYAEGYFVTKETLETYWQNYLGAPGSDAAEPWQINPLLAPTFSELPPTIVVTAGKDPLQDEGRAAYERMVAESVPSVYHHFPDQFHGFMTIWGYRPATAGQQVLWSTFKSLFEQKGQ